MTITKKTVADKLAAYLKHEISLPTLVDWAERAMMDAEFEESECPLLAEVISRLGVADVRSFGLTWEDSEALLQKLGYASRLEIVAA